MEFGGHMRRLKKMKRFVSVLLVLSVLFSLAVPFDLSVFAEEEPATGSDIHVFVYRSLDSAGNVIKYNNHEKYDIIFQRGDEPPYPDRAYELHVDNFDNDEKTNAALQIGGKERYKQPWYDYNYYVHRLIIKDKIAPRKMSGWFMYMKTLSDENVEGLEDKIDTSLCSSFYCTFNYCYLKNLDLTQWDVTNITTANGMFSHQDGKGLKTLNISNWVLPNCTDLSAFIYDSVLEELDLSALNPKKCESISSFLAENKKLKRVIFGPEFSVGVNSNNTNLNSAFENDKSLEELDLSTWNVPRARYASKMFKGCSSLQSINFEGGNWGASTYGTSYEEMFNGCSSLETIKASNMVSLLNSGSIFKDCTALKELDISTLGTYTPNNPGSFTLEGKSNIFEGCNELAWIKLSADGWPSGSKAGTSMPPKTAWRKIDEPNKDLRLTNDALFLNFQAGYAGTWVADSFITFRGNGGTPNFQTVDGNKGVELSFDENEIVATRNGYDFDGWWTEKTGGTQIHSPVVPEQWSYYAHWKEHHYKLKLNGNGGRTAGDQSEILASDNLGYTEFYELSNTLFTRDGYVLSSWNTRPNGMGTDFSGNDSVNRLTETDGAEVTLYAQWHRPDVIISFDSHGGDPVSDKHYTLQTGQTVLYGDLSDAYRGPDENSPAGYTFEGWYTEETGGEKITAETEVTVSRTLHARWEKNVNITLDANGGCFDGDSTKTITSKVCKHGRTLGVLPTPEHGKATFKGWFTESDGGTEITSDAIATEDVTYYAHWGYHPKFETNGGSFTSYPSDGYPIQSSPTYVITELPQVSKEHSEFLYWRFGERNLTQELSESTSNPKSITLDLSDGNEIEAVWSDRAIYTVTFDPNGGSGSPVSIKTYVGETVVGEPIVERNGYAFDGWYTNADGTGDPFDPTAPVTEDKTYYAKWAQKNCTLTFNPSGGIMYDEATVNVVGGRTIPALPGVNRAGYEFAGWWTEPNGGGTRLTTETVINGNQAYYAKWIPQNQTTDIFTYAIRWTQDSDSNVTNTGDKLVFHPTQGNDISAVMLVTFGIDSHQNDDSIAPGKVKITIPKSMFYENGTALDKNNVKLISTDAYEYTEVGDNYVFTNTVELPAGNNIEFTYTCKVSPRDVKGGYKDENGYYHEDFYKASFTPSIVVEDDEHPLNYSRTLGLEVHTQVNTIESKERSNILLEWNTTWGPEPADADEYFYVIWSLKARGNESSSQKYKLTWSEDTPHDGEVVYSMPALGTQSALMTSGAFNAVVVTKHLRKSVENKLTVIRNEAILDVEWDSGHTEFLRVTGATNAYIPADESGPRQFMKAVPDYIKTESHYINGGQELILAGDEVVMPYNITYSEQENQNNPVWNAVTEKYSAKQRDYVLTDGMKGDAVISTVTGSNSYNWGYSTEKALNDSDYYFDALHITLKEYDAICLGNNIWSDPYQHSAISDYDDLEVWIRKEGENNFTLFKTYAEISEINVTLPEKTVGYMIKHSSSFYATSIDVNTTLHLKASNRVVSLVRDDSSTGAATAIKNKAAIDRTVNGETSTLRTNTDTNGWISTYELNVGASTLYARKNCSDKESSVEINASTSTETVPVLIEGWGYNNSGNLKLLTSGVFYDLLPNEFSVDKNTVFVRPLTDNQPSRSDDADNYKTQYNKTDKFSSGYYSVEFTDNWQNTGKTLMTVRVTVPDGVKATGLLVFYEMKTSFVNLCINGLTQNNYVAFEDTTEGQGIPNSRSSTLSVIDSKYRPAYEAVDSAFTAYAKAATNCILPLTYEHGVRSVVKTEGVYKTRNETVGLNCDYSYFVSYTGSSGAHTKNLVFYDLIERRLEGPESEWYGTFEGVNISGAQGIESASPEDGTCAPVIYYSTKPKEQFTSMDFDLTRTDVWTTELPADKSTVTAIAVDCSKTNLQKDFVLSPRSEINIHVELKSPMAVTDNDIVAYNESYIKGMNQELEHGIEEVTRTSVTLHFSDPTLTKTAFPESGTFENGKVVNGEVVKNSAISYHLNVSNPDDTLTVYNIAVEDTLQADLAVNNTVMVSMSEGESIAIDSSSRISSYSLTQTGGQVKFSAVIASLSPGETMTITIPATVLADDDTIITNQACITGYNGIEYENINYVKSETTYHVVSDIKMKLKKVNSKGEGLAGAQLQVLNYNKTQTVIDNITSTNDVMTFDIQPGDYYLHEVAPPSDVYKTAADIPFTIDVEGICHVNGEMVNYVEMTDQPAYKIIFHENKPGGTSDEKQKIFRIYEPSDLTENKVTHFYDIPDWAGDEYVFAGWYSNTGYTYLVGITNDNTTAKYPLNFEEKTFTKAARTGSDPDYHFYAKWIQVGTVAQDEADTNVYGGTYRGFGIAGVQIRPQPGKVFDEETGEWVDATMYDPNIRDEGVPGYEYNDSAQPTPEGMRFVTSLSETLLSNVNGIEKITEATEQAKNFGVEYGYVVGTEANINTFTNYYQVKDAADYPLQYKGQNVNGKNTTGATREVDKDFRFISNVDCTSKQGKGTKNNNPGVVLYDHRNFNNYRLYTLVVTYEGDSAGNKGDKLAARAYMRYYDANGKLRVFYNTYKKSMYSACMCSFNQAYAAVYG